MGCSSGVGLVFSYRALVVFVMAGSNSVSSIVGALLGVEAWFSVSNHSSS